MANVLLSWDALAADTDATGVRVYKITDTGSAPACTAFVTADAVPTDGLPTGSSLVTDITNLTTLSFVDKAVATGSYYYSIFSYNSAGFSPCATTDLVAII
jgi:hypothetical protein|tara:strand:- start:163 stop:465 length:303 start_codon:yes stop_codon:yes gene_type:complete